MVGMVAYATMLKGGHNMICSNSMYHGDEYETEYEQQQHRDSLEYEAEESAIEEWKSSRID